MLNLGITNPGALACPPRRFGPERHARFLLLEPLALEGRPDPAAHDTLVARVRLPNGTWKQTATGRLRLVDDALVEALQVTNAPGSALSVLDLGASTGVASVDLYEKLSCGATEVVARVGDGYELEETVRDGATDAGWRRTCEA